MFVQFGTYKIGNNFQDNVIMVIDTFSWMYVMYNSN